MMRPILLLFAAAMLLPAPLAADAKRLPKNQQEIQLSFAPLVRQVAPGVVNIYTRRVTQQQARSPIFDDPVFRRFFGDGPLQGAPRQRIQQSLGSGVIVDRRGLVVTNNHVIEGAEEITVALHDRREFDAELVLADPRTDLAVLRIDPKGSKLTALDLMDSDDLEVGDLVLAIGNPFGVGQTVTSGIVSALGRTMVGTSDTQSFIQTDAAINPGNSGGALITMDGRVAGINTAIFSRTGGSHGIGFAIPANLVASVLHAAQAGHGVQRPWLGASGQSVTSELAQSLGLERPGGVLVNTVVRDSPAARAGLRPGDVVLAVNGKEVFDPRGLKFRIVTRNIGETVALDVFRKGTRRQVSLPLLAPPENPPREQIELSGNQPLAGALVANLSPALAEELGLDEGASGVIVLDVARGSPAQRFRVRPGDVILSVNGADVGRTRDLQVMLNGEPGARGWAIRLERRGQVITLAVR
ncbi:MAG: DegQ family serine endoprotease [Alphaproteobacteria bacterium]|nr:DegQ family serine endoprotease [Alphaproteobacteria bacterium]